MQEVENYDLGLTSNDTTFTPRENLSSVSKVQIVEIKAWALSHTPTLTLTHV